MWLGARQNPLLGAPDLTREGNTRLYSTDLQPYLTTPVPVPSPLALTLWHMERPDVSWLPRCLAAELDLERVISTRRSLWLPGRRPYFRRNRVFDF